MPRYRAWHIKEKRMFEVKAIVYFWKTWVTDRLVLSIDKSLCIPEHCAYEVWKEVILMQCTGLSVWSNPLFEWDLVTWKGIHWVWEVVWHFNELLIKHEKLSETYNPEHLGNVHLQVKKGRISVVGNIYENPDLLNP